MRRFLAVHGEHATNAPHHELKWDADRFCNAGLHDGQTSTHNSMRSLSLFSAPNTEVFCVIVIQMQ